jgi:hypothetical protein
VKAVRGEEGLGKIEVNGTVGDIVEDYRQPLMELVGHH